MFSRKVLGELALSIEIVLTKQPEEIAFCNFMEGMIYVYQLHIVRTHEAF